MEPSSAPPQAPHARPSAVCGTVPAGPCSALASSRSVPSARPHTEPRPVRDVMLAHRDRMARGCAGGAGRFQSRRDSLSSISLPFLSFVANHVFCQAVKRLKEGEAR